MNMKIRNAPGLLGITMAGVLFACIPACSTMKPLFTPAPQAAPAAGAPPAYSGSYSPPAATPTPVAVTSNGTLNSSYDSTLQNLATFISDIASVTPQKNPAATTPFVAAVRPIAQIGAAMGGPAGESILGVIGAIAAAIAGAGVAGAGVAAKKNKTITTHEKAIQELASNVTDKTKLTPATQHIVAKIVAGV